MEEVSAQGYKDDGWSRKVESQFTVRILSPFLEDFVLVLFVQNAIISVGMCLLCLYHFCACSNNLLPISPEGLHSAHD